MTSEKQKFLFIGLVLTAVLLVAGLLSAALRQTTAKAASEECIRCHVTSFNEGIQSRHLHPPFWERNCTSCHLPVAADWNKTVSAEVSQVLTGSRVDQRNLWRKTQLFSGQTGVAREHLVSLPGLEMEAAFRFRIVTSTAEPSSAEQETGLWLGLRPEDVTDFSVAQPFEISRQHFTSLPALSGPVSIYRSGNTVFVSWTTDQLLSSWIELQELEGVNANVLAESAEPGAGTAANQHPTLAEPAELAIKACYQCHPESTLGTSHPVRLYGGRDVRIPDTLPTVNGMLTCVTCHNPHGSQGKKLVREIIKTKLCVTCHYTYKNSSQSTMFD